MANTYAPKGNYLDSGLSAADQALMDQYKRSWAEAEAKGDAAGKAAAHQSAETLRAGYGYSGGSDGSEYLALPRYTGGVAGMSGSSGTASPSARSAEDYIRAMYAAQEQATLNALKSAYDENVNLLNAAGAKIPAQYETARNQTAGNAELEKASFNEYAAGHGLNSGAGGQARLSMDNALQSNLTHLAGAEANALSELELRRLQLDTQYKNDIARAVSAGDFEEARALYNDLVRVDDLLATASQAQTNANEKARSASQAAQAEQAAAQAKAAEQARADALNEKKYQDSRNDALRTQAVSLAGKGYSAAQIAQILGISEAEAARYIPASG